MWLEDLDVDAGLYLEDTKGRRLKIRDSSWATDRWFEISVERGTYYIRVQAVGNGSNSYNLRYQTRYQRDDYARSTNTTGTITVNGSRTGEIEFTGDRDWFATQLTSGQTYWIEHKGRPTEHGTLTNTAITGIFDAAGSSVRWTRDDDSGVGGNARVVSLPRAPGATTSRPAPTSGSTGTVLPSDAAPRARIPCFSPSTVPVKTTTLPTSPTLPGRCRWVHPSRQK